MSRRRTLLLLPPVLALLASCAIREDAAPRNIADDGSVTFGQVATGDAAAGDRSIYLLAPGGPDELSQLRSVRRETPVDPVEVLRSLLLGANVEESADGLGSAIPPELEVRSARTVGARLTIDMNDALSELTDVGLRAALAQIVATATDIGQVQQVRLRVDGQNQAWPIANGEIVDRPLTIYDFSGFLETSQPAFTALPSTPAP